MIHDDAQFAVDHIPYWYRLRMMGSTRANNKFDPEAKLIMGRISWPHCKAAMLAAGQNPDFPPGEGPNAKLKKRARSTRSIIMDGLPVLVKRCPDYSNHHPRRIAPTGEFESDGDWKKVSMFTPAILCGTDHTSAYVTVGVGVVWAQETKGGSTSIRCHCEGRSRLPLQRAQPPQACMVTLGFKSRRYRGLQADYRRLEGRVGREQPKGSLER